MSPSTGRNPLIGTLLATQLVFNIGFYAVLPFLAIHLHDDLALTGAAIFSVSAAVLWWMVPPGTATAGSRPVDGEKDPTRSWREALTHRRYVLFCIAYSSYLLSYHQLYVALPVELDRTDAPDLTLALLFGAASLLVILGQLPLSAVTRRFPARVVLPVGFAVLASAFVVVAVTAPQIPVTGAAAVLPAAAMVALLVLGQMIVVPVAMTLVPDFAAGASLGAFYGLLATAGGTATLLGSFVIGPLLDLGRSAGPLAGVQWWAMATFPALSAVALHAILRPDPPYPPKSRPAGRPSQKRHLRHDIVTIAS